MSLSGLGQRLMAAVKAAAPSGSSIFSSEQLSPPSTGDTITKLASETMVSPKPAHKPTVLRTAADVLRHLENTKPSALKLSTKSELDARLIVSELDFQRLSDGTCIRINRDGAFIRIVLEKPLEIGKNAETKDNLSADCRALDRAIRVRGEFESFFSPHLPIRISKGASVAYVREFADYLLSKLRTSPITGARICLDSKLGIELAKYLDGKLLPSGKVVRVNSKGMLSYPLEYTLGDNGWRKSDIASDLRKITAGVIEAAKWGKKFNVFLPPKELQQSEFLDGIRVDFNKLRERGLGDSMILRTDKSQVDLIPGFIGVKRHVKALSREVDLSGAVEQREITEIDRFRKGATFKVPLVLWVKRDTIGNAAVSYIKELKDELGTNLKVLTTPKFRENHRELMHYLTSLRPPDGGPGKFKSLLDGASTYLANAWAHFRSQRPRAA